MKYLTTILLIISFLIDYGSTLMLNDNWNVSLYQNDKFIKGFETKIPAGTYTGAVENIYWNDNDVKYRYIGNCTTYFSKEFTTDEILRKADHILLVFHGIDTFASITLNGYKLGDTSNMFIRYTFDITKYLLNDSGKKNYLNVTIDSAVEVAKERYNNQSKNYIVYPTCVPNEYNGECHVNHIRKMQASFAWDWGPAVPSSGIWRDVEIVPIYDIHIMDCTLDVHQINNKNWKINVTTLLEVQSNSENKPVVGFLQATLENTKFNIVSSENISIKNGEMQKIVSIILDVPEKAVLRWWPNGFGSQHLYNVIIELKTESRNETLIKRVGFRTVELVQEPLEKGLSFYFRINNIPIFAKGSNVIPIHIEPEKSTDYVYLKHLLWSAKETHMNMLRVWGGGVYESEMFYDLADALGIMIWQDFMFACSMYQTTSNFLRSVKTEVIQNVWRLKSHTSVVIWAGNNENEAALYGNWYGTENDQVYRDDYIKLYVDLIRTEVKALDPTRPFVVSSPSNGLWADENEWIGTNPYSTLYGDIHYYNYINDGWNINNYLRPRFSSEYGFQSLPSIYTLKPVAKNPSKDLLKDSEFIRHRQHLPMGNTYMEMLIAKNFKIPVTNDSHRDFENYIYLSQINQAQSVKIQTESYRQSRSSLNDIGEGYTMGALYWQLNDVWQAPSWSSIDINGRWKILHNYAKDFFAPIIISPRLSTTNNLTIFIISDELSPRFNCTVQVNVHKIYSDHPHFYSKIYNNVSIPANSAYELATIKLEDIFKIANSSYNFVDAKKKYIIELILNDFNSETIAPPNYVFSTQPKNLDLPSNCAVFVYVAYAYEKINGYSITIETSCTLLFVWFDIEGYMVGKFSENGFHILRGSRTIYFNNSPFSIDIDTFTRKLRLVTLNDLYTLNKTSSPVICSDCIF